MFSVFVILTKYLLKIFATLCFSDIECFFSINVIFWSYWEPSSVKKRIAKLPKVFIFHFIISGDITFMEVFFAFLTIRFLKGATVFKLFVITDLRDPITRD